MSIFLGASHWESLHVFLWHESKNGKLKKQKSWFWSYFFTLAPIVTFLMLSVSVAWFSWPHLIGTEVNTLWPWIKFIDIL